MTRQRDIFFSLIGDELSLGAVMEQVSLFIRKHPDKQYRIIIGTDSAPRQPVQFVSAITIWRIGNGAIHFWTRSPKVRTASLRERIYQEAMRSITLAQEVRSQLKDILGEEIFWDDQIHIDVGHNGPTREFVDSVVGMVKGYGFEAVTKPYSFGASSVADRHT